MMKRIDYFIPTRIVFGAGRLKELATLSLPGKKALLCVTEDKLMEKLGIQQRVIELLGQNGVSVAVFDKVTPNPTRTGVMAAAALAKESGCDFVIGLGGGSSIDTAKAASIMMANPGDLWDYASAGSGGRKPVSGAFPVVAISTTAGTGTEADPYAVVTNEETNEKLDFTLDEIFPASSIIDPELMLTLPHKLTLFQGFDALFHASPSFSPSTPSKRSPSTCPSSPRTARTSNPAATSPTPRISCAGSRSPSYAPPPTTSSRRPSAGSSPTCRTARPCCSSPTPTIKRSARCCPRNSTPSAKSWAKRPTPPSPATPS